MAPERPHLRRRVAELDAREAPPVDQDSPARKRGSRRPRVQRVTDRRDSRRLRGASMGAEQHRAARCSCRPCERKPAGDPPPQPSDERARAGRRYPRTGAACRRNHVAHRAPPLPRTRFEQLGRDGSDRPEPTVRVERVDEVGPRRAPGVTREERRAGSPAVAVEPDRLEPEGLDPANAEAGPDSTPAPRRPGDHQAAPRLTGGGDRGTQRCVARIEEPRAGLGVLEVEMDKPVLLGEIAPDGPLAGARSPGYQQQASNDRSLASTGDGGKEAWAAIRVELPGDVIKTIAE